MATVVSNPADSIDYVYNDAGVLVSVSRDPDFVGPISPSSVGMNANMIDVNSTYSLSPDKSIFSGLPSFEDLGVNITQSISGMYSKVKANASRLMSSNSTQRAPQTEGLGIVGAFKALSGFGPAPQGATTLGQSISNVGTVFQSSMLKVFGIVVLVAIIVMFFMSYIQAKGAKYAS